MDECEREQWHHHHGHGLWTPFKIVGMVIGGLALAVVFGFAFGYFVMLLWNWLMPGIFGLKTITFWQAFGIVILGKLIFGGHGFHGQHGHHGGHRDKWERKKWWNEHKLDFESEWAPGGDFRNMRYYKEYWRTDGKALFEAFLAKKKAGEGENKE